MESEIPFDTKKITKIFTSQIGDFQTQLNSITKNICKFRKETIRHIIYNFEKEKELENLEENQLTVILMLKEANRLALNQIVSISKELVLKEAESLFSILEKEKESAKDLITLKIKKEIKYLDQTNQKEFEKIKIQIKKIKEHLANKFSIKNSSQKISQIDKNDLEKEIELIKKYMNDENVVEVDLDDIPLEFLLDAIIKRFNEIVETKTQYFQSIDPPPENYEKINLNDKKYSITELQPRISSILNSLLFYRVNLTDLDRCQLLYSVSKGKLVGNNRKDIFI